MAEDPERAAAFELLTDTWEKSARLRRRPFEHVASWELPGFRLSFSRAAFAGVVVALIAAIGTARYLRSDDLATAVGEQRALALEDGTRVYLNTDTLIAQHYDKEARRVELKRGEALFEVAKRKDWPFIVTAGDKQVRALGTAFVVRRDAERLSVTLVEGKVTVTTPHPPELWVPPAPVAGRGVEGSSTRSEQDPAAAERAIVQTHRESARAAPLHGVEREGPTQWEGGAEGAAAEVFTLSPGERLTFASTRPPQLDRPPLDRVTAWQRGQVALDSTPLADAVAEMNRYSRVRLVIQDPRIAAIPVSGIFRAGDSDNFARAVAKTYGLIVVDGRDEIVLSEGKP